MRRIGIAIGLVGIAAALGASVPAQAEPPASAPIGPVAASSTLGFDIRYVDADGRARILPVQDFPR